MLIIKIKVFLFGFIPISKLSTYNSPQAPLLPVPAADHAYCPIHGMPLRKTFCMSTLCQDLSQCFIYNILEADIFLPDLLVKELRLRKAKQNL